jgi:hypothetical protein
LVLGEALPEAGSEFVSSGSFPCKKFCIRSRKLGSSTNWDGGSSAGGAGHGTGFGGGTLGALAQAANKSGSASIKISDLTVFILSQ